MVAREDIVELCEGVCSSEGIGDRVISKDEPGRDSRNGKCRQQNVSVAKLFRESPDSELLTCQIGGYIPEGNERAVLDPLRLANLCRSCAGGGLGLQQN